jgi:DNA ligase (NAD+)
VIAASIAEYFESAKNQQILLNLLDEVTLEKPEENTSAQIFEGMNFVITGSVEHFANRNEVKAVIEERGGKVTGSVTSKTNYLINNDTTSNSSKNKKAKELNIPIISEEDFLKMLG